MRKILFAIFIFISLGASSVEARLEAEVTTVFRVASFYGGATISQAAVIPTNLMLHSSGLAFTYVGIQNNDGSNNLYCSTNINVATSGVNKGLKVSVGQFIGIPLAKGEPSTVFMMALRGL